MVLNCTCLMINDTDIKYFYMLIGCIFGEMLFRSFAHISIGLFDFSLLNYNSFLNIS